jgi:hypothetical protein
MVTASGSLAVLGPDNTTAIVHAATPEAHRQGESCALFADAETQSDAMPHWPQLWRCSTQRLSRVREGVAMVRRRSRLAPDGRLDTGRTVELCTERYVLYKLRLMASRINLSLDPEYSEKLSRLAKRMHVQEGTLAKSLLSTALDGADPDAAHIVRLLDGIPGAYERTQEGIDQAGRREGISLDDLA